MRVKHIRASALQELWVVPRNFSSQFRIFWTGTFFIQIPDSEKKMEVKKCRKINNMKMSTRCRR